MSAIVQLADLGDDGVRVVAVDLDGDPPDDMFTLLAALWAAQQRIRRLLGDQD